MYTSEPTNTMSPFTFFHPCISSSSTPISNPLKKPHSLPNLQLPGTTSINLHQPSHKIASHLHIFLSRLELNHDPLWSHQGQQLRRSMGNSWPKVLLDGSTTNGQQLVSHTEPLLFGPCTCFFLGKWFRKNGSFKKLQQFSSRSQPPM